MYAIFAIIAYFSIWQKTKLCTTIVNVMYLLVVSHNMSNCQEKKLFY